MTFRVKIIQQFSFGFDYVMQFTYFMVIINNNEKL